MVKRALTKKIRNAAIVTGAATVLFLHGLVGSLASPGGHGHEEEVTGRADPKPHIVRMDSGNDEYQAEYGKLHREKLSHGQEPSLIVMQCADSRDDLITQARLPPGYVFAMGTNAGNIVNPKEPSTLANIIYHLKHLKGKNRAYVVMGHYGCGGIKGLDEMEHLEPEIVDHLKLALPAKEFVEKQIEERKLEVSPETRHRMIVEANVLAQIKNLMGIHHVRSAVEQRRLAVIPIISDLNTGELHFSLPTLQQHGLLENAKAHFGLQKWLQSQHRLQDQQLARLGPARPRQANRPEAVRRPPALRPVRSTAFRRR